MGTVEKIALGIIGVAFVTTLALPDRKTTEIAATMFNGFVNALGRAMGRT